MLIITDKSKCCGCTACINICPKHCIMMEEDKEGFLYPQINHFVCIDCGLCEKVCPVLHPVQTKEKPVVFAAINNNLEVRMQSSSGGIFTLLAEQTIKKGGVVFGACFDENWVVLHQYTETVEGLERFRSSKYVQSDMKDSFRDAMRFLKQGREVLFSGTPCQIAGLKSYLRKPYNALLTVEVACHGVPSPKVWNNYILDKKRSITSINFRSKVKGWKNFRLELEYGKSKEYTPLLSKNLYMNAFLSNLTLRPSCYNCVAKLRNSQAEITIGDFWGVDKIAPEIDDDRGCSLVIVHSPKILQLLKTLDCQLYSQNLDKALKYNQYIAESCLQPVNRKFFFALLNRCNLIFAYHMVSSSNIIFRFIRTLYRIL